MTVKAITTNLLYEHCVEKGFYMATPNWEIPAVYKIIDVLNNDIQHAKQALLIGTPVALTYSDNNAFKNKVISIELTLAKELLNITDNLRIDVGNLVNSKKAYNKAVDWEALLPGYKTLIKSAPVDSNYYRNQIDLLLTHGRYTKKTPDNPLVVVLMNSGVWTGSEYADKTYGFPTNFKDESIILTNSYNNLHIIAMTRKPNKYGFTVVHLNNGKIKEI